jgi:hypothetical protein
MSQRKIFTSFGSDQLSFKIALIRYLQQLKFIAKGRLMFILVILQMNLKKLFLVVELNLLDGDFEVTVNDSINSIMTEMSPQRGILLKRRSGYMFPLLFCESYYTFTLYCISRLILSVLPYIS